MTARLEHSVHEMTSLIYSQWIDPEWYKKIYPDLINAELTPHQHYDRYGYKEGRNPCKYFKSEWYTKTYLSHDKLTENALLHYLGGENYRFTKPHPLVDLSWIKSENQHSDYLAAAKDLLENGEKIDRKCRWFSKVFYTEKYEDARLHDFPEDHFLAHGLVEGRIPSPEFRVMVEDKFFELKIDSNLAVDRFVWLGKRYIVYKNLINFAIVTQILEQSDFDRAILAPGYNAIPYLKYFFADDLDSRDGFDFNSLENVCSEHYENIVLIGRLSLGGAQKYALELAECLHKTLSSKTLVVITDATDEQNAATPRKYLQKLQGIPTLSFASAVKNESHKRPTLLTLVVKAVNAKRIFSINSDLFFHAVNRHGNSLASQCQIFVWFFSEAPKSIGAPYVSVYLKSVAMFATIVSDNRSVLEAVRRRLPVFMRNQTRVIPPPVDIPDRDSFKNKLRWRLRMNSDLNRRYLWIGRWEKFKGTEILFRLADLLDFDGEIDVYGTGLDQMPSHPRLIQQGELTEDLKLNFDSYHAFLHTSLFEGMPNVVLEMIAQGLPVVCTDVGGLRETFTDESIWFIKINERNIDEVAKSFQQTLIEIHNNSAELLESKLTAAFNAIEHIHAPSNFDKSISKLLKQKRHF